LPQFRRCRLPLWTLFKTSILSLTCTCV